MSYFASILQNASVDAGNTSSTNLAAGATWYGLSADSSPSGTPRLTLGYGAIQIIFKATVASGNCTCTVYIDQSNDAGTIWDVIDQ